MFFVRPISRPQTCTLFCPRAQDQPPERAGLHWRLRAKLLNHLASTRRLRANLLSQLASIRRPRASTRENTQENLREVPSLNRAGARKHEFLFLRAWDNARGRPLGRIDPRVRGKDGRCPRSIGPNGISLPPTPASYKNRVSPGRRFLSRNDLETPRGTKSTPPPTPKT